MGTEYIIRQQILFFLNALKPGRAGLTQVMFYPYFVQTKTEKDAIKRELDFLVEEGFAADVTAGIPAEPPRYRITTKGVRQVDGYAAQDPLVWGPDARI